MEMNVKVPYERFEELIRAEVLLKLYNDDTANGKVIYEEPTQSKKTDDIEGDKREKRDISDAQEEKTALECEVARGAAEGTLKDVINIIVKRGKRVGDLYYINDKILGVVRGGNLNINVTSARELKINNAKSISRDLEGSKLVRNQSRGKTYKQIYITDKEKNIRCWVIENELLKEMNLFDEVFKIEKVDRDQFAYQGR